MEADRCSGAGPLCFTDELLGALVVRLRPHPTELVDGVQALREPMKRVNQRNHL